MKFFDRLSTHRYNIAKRWLAMLLEHTSYYEPLRCLHGILRSSRHGQKS